MKRALAFLVPAILALPAQSLAVSPKSPQEQQALKLFRQASEALDAGRKEEAADKVRQAFKLHQLPDYACVLGKIELDLGHGSKAAEAIHTCLKILPSTDVVLRYKIEDGFSRAKALSGTLRIHVNIAEADVIVGGKTIGKTPLKEPAFVEPGRHLVEIRAPGYAPELRIVDLPAGSEFDLDLTLKPAELTAPPLPAKTSTTLTPPLLPKATEQARRSSPAPPPSAPQGLNVRPGFLLAGFGIGVVGAAVGAGSLVAAVAAGREAKAMNQALLEDETRECTAIESGNPCFDVPGRIDDAMIFTAVGAAGIGLAVVGGGLITYEFLRADAQKNRPVGAALIAAPSGGILAFKGAW